MLKADGQSYETVGQVKTIDQIMEEVLKDQDFYEESGGGLTLSGGEIFAQFEFAKAILKAAKKLDCIPPLRPPLIPNTSNS